MRASAIDLIVNCQARLFQRDPSLLGRVTDVARGRCRVHVTATLEELDQVCEQLAARGSDLVLLSGGDGTLMAGVSALARHFDELPNLAPIPAGTACTVARNWGLHLGKTDACLARLLEGPRRLVPRPSLCIDASRDGLSQRRIGFIVGTGLVAKFFRLYYEHGAPGYAGSAALVSRIFVESFVGGPLARRVLDPLPCRLRVNGEEHEPNAWSLVCVAVVQNLGIGMRLTYRAGSDPQRPHLVATPMAPGQLGPRAPLVLAGKSLGGPGHIDALIDELQIEFDGDGPWVVDGELLQSSKVEVRAGPILTVASP
jgi:diacylglycerol kinase (ATP)